MKNIILKLLLILGLLNITNGSYAQLIFPQGKEKKMTTSLEYIYDETDLPFKYRNGKVTDLSWQLLSDSIPADWFVVACMNGTCISGVPQNGRFDNILQLPDSIGFLKYHFDFKGVPGTAIIRFILSNNLLFGKDADTATFNITYKVNNAVKNSAEFSNVSVYPNPSKDAWTIRGELQSSDISLTLTDASGRFIKSYLPFTDNNNFSIQIENSSLDNGIYFLKLQSKNSTRILQLMKY
jgi:hypothetical protein